MDLSTKYLGLKLRNPLVAAASPLTSEVENIKKLVDAGISAVVMNSLFEEQIAQESFELAYHLEEGSESFAEALTYFPEAKEYQVGPEQYVANLQKAKKAVSVPVIASLNGVSAGGWLKYAKNLEDAGADAIELNIYHIPTNPQIRSQEVEQVCLDVLTLVKSQVKVPVAIKLSPYFSAMAEFTHRLDQAGADGLVLFNRFYQPDIDLDTLEALPKVTLSSHFEMRLPLRWIGILHGRVKASLAATTGVHHAYDVIKMVMAGADATMLCSTLLTNGISYTGTILKDMESWMKSHEYTSLKQMKGSMSQMSCASPEAYERANYIKTLQSYHR
jgi:dihydroorotate dehydrogenase (fumarate)